MSKERDEVVVKTSAASTPIKSESDRKEEHPQYAQSVVKPGQSKAEMKARLVQVLERGMVHDRMMVPLPADVHGEWVRNDPLEIARMQTLGFQIDHEFAPKRALHSDGTSSAVVADVIHMICPREVKEVIDEIRHEQFYRLNAPKEAKEDRELIANTLRDTEGEIKPFADSVTHSVDRDAIAEALRQVDIQTQGS